MPLPKPNSGEAHNAFIGRCHEALVDEFEDQARRNAVCERQWQERGKASMDDFALELEHKAVMSGVEVKDAAKGIVEAIVARTGVTDADGDLFLPGAFGTRDVRVSSYNHRSWPSRGGEMPVGKGRITERGEEVVARLKFFMSTQAGREHFEHIKEMGDLQEWSYGWPPGAERVVELTSEQRDEGIQRAIKEVPVVEVSPVMLGASVNTRTLAVKTDKKGEVQETEEQTSQEETPARDDGLKDAIQREVVRYEVWRRKSNEVR